MNDILLSYKLLYAALKEIYIDSVDKFIFVFPFSNNLADQCTAYKHQEMLRAKRVHRLSFSGTIHEFLSVAVVRDDARRLALDRSFILTKPRNLLKGQLVAL